jgi:hypothetical protein
MIVEGIWVGLSANLNRLQHIRETLGDLLDDEKARSLNI